MLSERGRPSIFWIFATIAMPFVGIMVRYHFHDREKMPKDGAIVIVRPDQYVAGIFPLNARHELKTFFAQHMLPAK